VNLEVLPDAAALAQRAAAVIAQEARTAVAVRGRFLLAMSGGRTPGCMLQALAHEAVPWELVHVLQVDERVTRGGTSDRNLTALRTQLLDHVPLPPGHIHAMPVEERDMAAAALYYARTVEALGGTPAVLDLVHLGLGSDGHTASLFPGDKALEVRDTAVAVSGVQRGWRRMTLTLPVLDRARCILWLIRGETKARALSHLLHGDESMPAGRVSRERAIVLCDRDAAGTFHADMRG